MMWKKQICIRVYEQVNMTWEISAANEPQKAIIKSIAFPFQKKGKGNKETLGLSNLFYTPRTSETLLDDAQ